ncbi:MAG: pirin family protein [Reichenbachiella sp.]|uniref:pirin family protein n=1 Tax=Reichenbachiella sp. TaxID=2184521 RepID=UPI0032631464
MNTDKIIAIKPMNFPWEAQDPFLFCAYHRDEYPAGNDQMGPDPVHLNGRNIGQDFTVKNGWRMYHGSAIPGFPYHPHRGFETITINKEGIVDHSDSLGAAGRFGKGDVQWMTAGKGVQHSEMFPLLNKDKENPLEIFQVWLNLPKANKFVEPHFKMLWNDVVPVVTEKDDDNKSTVIDVIAGSYKDTQAPAPTPNSWAANPENLVNVLTVKMEAGAQWTFPAAGGEVNRVLYFYKGSEITVEGESVDQNHLIQLNSLKDIIIVNSDHDAYFLMLQGKPINEPVAQYGPFVMNTEEEIRQAFEDYQKTAFGGWPWPLQEQVHDRDKGRFALHADGREEVR